MSSAICSAQCDTLRLPVFAVSQANMIFVDQPLNVGFSYSEVGAFTGWPFLLLHWPSLATALGCHLLPLYL